jgi:hypothetical protein
MKRCFRHYMSWVLLLCAVAGCSGRPAATESNPSQGSAIPDRTKTPEVDPALAKSLEEAFRAYHNGMTSDDKADHFKALAAWLGNEHDVKSLFAKYPTTPGLYAMSLASTLQGDVEQYAAREKQGGDVKAVEAVDARLASTPVSDVVGITPADVPVFLLRVHYEKETSPVLFAPILQVKGRWAWMPELEKMAPLFNEKKE